MAKPLFAIEKSAPTDDTVLHEGEFVYSPDQDVFHYKGKTYVSPDSKPPQTLAYRGEDGRYHLHEPVLEDQVAEWTHRYKNGSHRIIGAICSVCDMWSGMMTPRCPWCGRIMKNPLYNQEGKFLGTGKAANN